MEAIILKILITLTNTIAIITGQEPVALTTNRPVHTPSLKIIGLDKNVCFQNAPSGKIKGQ